MKKLFFVFAFFYCYGCGGESENMEFSDLEKKDTIPDFSVKKDTAFDLEKEIVFEENLIETEDFVVFEAEQIENTIDECPDGVCEYGFCKNGNFADLPDIASFCTKQCLGDEYGQEYSDEELDKMMCGEFLYAACCGNIKTDESAPEYWCLPKEKCCRQPAPFICGDNCCREDEKCNPQTLTCEPKCNPPASIYCKNECCPNNYKCECEEQGGFCKPIGAVMCDCETKAWCVPLQECVENKTCQVSGKTCKPLGAEDCPEDEDCFCKPGYVCTHKKPSCCPSDAQTPCGDYCCPEDNDPATNQECLPEIKNCLGSGEEYCPQWKIKCPIGEECMKKKSGCKEDGAEECDGYDAICPVTDKCVGIGKGKDNSGCCPKQNPVPCSGYCCPSGTHCEASCGGCVEDGYKCCPDGSTVCLENKICWSGGGKCLDTITQDCGSYYCNAGEVCSSGPQKCCAETTPKTCGDKCCESYETCYESKPTNYSLCVDEQGGEKFCYWFGYAGYCKPGYECCGIGCMPIGSDCYKKGFTYYGYYYCQSGFEECSDAGCIPVGSSCCYGCGKKYCPAGYACCFGGNCGKCMMLGIWECNYNASTFSEGSPVLPWEN